MIVMWLGGGLVLLIAGAELLVRGAARLSNILRISPVIVGLTVVAYATGSPELAVGIKAGFAGRAGIVVGNVVGSNIFNLLCVLGLAALIVPLSVRRRLIRLDVPILIGSCLAVWLLAAKQWLRPWAGLVLLGGFVVYTFFLVTQGRLERVGDDSSDLLRKRGAGRSGPVVLLNIVFVAAGLGLLVVGAHWLVEGAAALARWFGVSDLTIGLTVVAVGTSLPELAASVAAGIKGERDIAVGNAVGSSIFNLMAVLGAASMAAGERGIQVSASALTFDFPVMLAAAVLCLPVFFTGVEISRSEGALLLFYYVLYVAHLVLHAGANEGLRYLDAAFWYVFLPLTLLILGFSILHNRKLYGFRRG
ncbi:MAG: calcium/sodium antiporter [Acidobacteriota bacterium]|jgi:cation:H+ antiporter